jgi:putative peptidoglycan lipid II flippase
MYGIFAGSDLQRRNRSELKNHRPCKINSVARPIPEERVVVPTAPPDAPAGSRLAQLLSILRPSHSHTAYTATVLLMSTTFLSRIIGLARVKYIAWLFGAGPQTDAYLAAFRLPDLMNYFLVGGAASITFVTILNRYRERGEEAEGERVLSIVLNVVGLVIIIAIPIVMLIAAPYIRHTNPGFTPEQVALSAKMTRILLPGQLFFFMGGVLGATLLVRRQFLYQGLSGIVYNFGIIFGGVALAHQLGIPALAVGATGGAFVGAFALNAWGAHKAGVRYRFEINLRHPGLGDWLRMTLPLMAGMTLPFLDDYIVGYFASHGAGEITRLATAKQLFGTPMAMLAQAAGAASLPFFARLWAQQKQYEFAVEVAESVSRVASLSLLVASGMIALSQPLVDFVFLGGRFTSSDVRQTAAFFALYSLSLFLWAAQALYTRAFYAAGNTLFPMVAGTVVTIVSLPIYAGMYRWQGASGLAIASDFGITLQTLTMAILLHRKRMVSLASLDYRELGRCLAAAAFGGIAVWAGIAAASRYIPVHSRLIDLIELIAGSAIWMLLGGWLLNRLGSALPRTALKRFGIASAK